jgi:uncharacterized protein YdeI (YjbR/CyaY-like superfamily)
MAKKKAASKTGYSPAVDAYIEEAAPFAKPILKRLREWMHKADPEIVETMKWSCPHFELNGLVSSLAAFKEHVRFGYWRGMQVTGETNIMERMGQTEMAAAKIKDVKELPSESLIIKWTRKAIELNRDGVKGGPMVNRAKKPPKPKLAPPSDLHLALQKNAKARKVFDGFPPSAQRDYIEWISQAKQETTRQRRLEQAIEWLSEGKRRNWKYENC